MIKDLINSMVEADPNYQELLRIQEQKINSAISEVQWLMNETSKYEDAANKGNAEAMYKCFLIYASHEGRVNNGNIYVSDTAIKWLKKAVDKRYTNAILTYMSILITGEYNNCEVNVCKSAVWAASYCDYFTEEALEDENIKNFIEEVKKMAEEEKEEEQFSKNMGKRFIIGIVFVVVFWVILIMINGNI